MNAVCHARDIPGKILASDCHEEALTILMEETDVLFTYRLEQCD
jgi:hypothetical protein